MENSNRAVTGIAAKAAQRPQGSRRIFRGATDRQGLEWGFGVDCATCVPVL